MGCPRPGISQAWDIGYVGVKFIYLFLNSSPMIITLDCDGTVEYGSPPGPVTVRVVESWIRKGYLVVLISDSANCSSLSGLVLWMPTPRGRRHEAISRLQKVYNDAVVYISDNEEDADVCGQVLYPEKCRLIRPWRVEEWIGL